MKELPIEFKNRMSDLLGDSFADFLLEFEKPPVKAFRVNTDKISLNDFEKINIFSKEKISYVNNGFFLDFEKIGNHPYHHAGVFYVQEPAAMAPAECIQIDPEWTVLDMCAAPGGKSTQLRNKLNQNSVLVCNEIIASRCKILTGNIERLGLKNTVTTCLDSEKIASAFPNTFDLIMVDAPCSGEGMFRKDEVAISEWNIDNVNLCAKRQKLILENAVKSLKNNGYIVYATCTFSLEENEMVIDEFLQNHPEFEIVPVKEEVKKVTKDGIAFDGCKCENINFARRFYPHMAKGEGQFMAILHNTHNAFENKINSTLKSNVTDKSVFEFLDDALVEYNKDFVRSYNGKPVYFTPDFDIKDGLAFSCGITIGEKRKNYIHPHHQFFMGLGPLFKRKINLSADCPEILKYLRGEEIATDCPNGWAVVMVEGCALGGVKVVNGLAKNHYPKGLRLLN